MSVSTFEDSLSDLADVRRVSPADCEETVAELLEAPAIGVPLPYEGVGLPADVTTDFDAGDLQAAETGVTPVGLGIADLGTVTVRSTAAGDELVALYADRHVAVVHADDLVADVPAAYERLSEEFASGRDSQVLATGASATADMGALVQGVHGPEAVTVVILEP